MQGFIKEKFSTSEVRPSERIDAWRERVQGLNFNFNFDTGIGRPYRGRFSRFAIEGFQVVAFEEEQAFFRREARHIRSDGIGVFELFAPIRGRCSVEQFGTVSECGPGSLILVDAAAPFEIRQPDRMSALIFKTSRSTLEQAPLDVESLCGRAIDASRGLPRLTLDLFRSIGGQGEWLDRIQFRQACQHLIELVTLMTGAPEDGALPPHGVRAATLRRLRAHIREHANDPATGTRTLAAAFGLSERYVQMLFQEAGTTVRDYVRAQRLENARRLLASPAGRGRTITEIAYGCGFASSAHFSTAFKDRYGQSPRAFRRQALG